jgi:DNA-binding NarL/FixJ family response regulator
MRKRGPVRVLIADDSGLFVSALEAMLAGEDEIEVVGSAFNGEEAVRLVTALGPDVVLLDISMPVLDGFAAARRITAERPETTVLMLTGSAAETDRRKARAAGASGYVTKDRMAFDLVPAIRDAAGESWSLS